MGQVHNLSPSEALVTALCILGRVLPPRSPSLLVQQAAWYNQWNKQSSKQEQRLVPLRAG